MPDSRVELGPLSDAITAGIRVEVMARHSPEHSALVPGEWVFVYTVRITNNGTERVQLQSRHWIIADALEEIREVKGPGVIGKQPVLAPGESFEYSSYCRLQTPSGRMHGTYQMTGADGELFDVRIAPFLLRAAYTVQ